MFTKLIRIGRDAEMKYLQTGTAILEFSAVYDIGFGDKKKPQWIRVAMFGQRAEKLVSHFTKGKLIVACMDDVKSEAWIKDGEARSGLSAKLIEFEFAGGQSDAPQQQAPQQSTGGFQAQAPQQYSNQSPAQQQQPYQAPQQQGGFLNQPAQQQGGFQQPMGK
jgi:single-strand DNA-binding protein